VSQPGDEQVLEERDLCNWQLIERFQQCLEKAFGSGQLHPSFSDSRRRMSLSHYLSLFLFGLFNPTVRTLRGLCQASRLKRVQAQVCGRGVNLGSFSEAQHLLDPCFLERVFEQLSAKVAASSAEGPLAQWQWLARDGSLFRALPRMEWALHGAGKAGAANRAVRLHLGLNILEDKPEVAAVRPGKVCERVVWRQQWKKGQAYVGDRYFGEDHKVFGQLAAKQCAYVLRLREQSTIDVDEELPVSATDRQSGVLRQAWVYLGCRPRYRSVRLRVVWVKTAADNTLILATNLSVEQLPAELIWMLYRKRWQIELFFRWIKCILGCRHWLAESSNGVAIQIYLALIAGLLLQLYIGRKPNKRMMELIQLHQQGVATDQELIAGLQRERARIALRKKS